MPGPPPKRDGERRRRNKPDIALRIGQAQPATPPPEDRKWHITAKRIYRSMKKSGQTTFWQETDWEYARWTMDELSKALKTAADKPLRAGQLAELNKMMAELMVTEPARRRARVELQHAATEVSDDSIASVTDITDFQGLYG